MTNIAAPWLRRYDPDVPSTLPLPAETALASFERHAARHPASPALYYFDTVVSFGELNTRAEALAVAMQERGVRRGDRVALCLQNVPAFPLAQYAAWKCGAIVVPLSPMLRHDEMVHELRDAGASVLVSLRSLLPITAPAAGEAGVPLLIAASDRDFLSHAALVPQLVELPPLDGAEDLAELVERYRGQQATQPVVTPNDIAYLVYTSGTTGPPKGAMNTHGNVVYCAQVYQSWAHLGPRDVILGGAPLFHITGLIAHLATGAFTGIPVILAYRFEAGTILRLQERWGGTFTCMAITAYIALLNHPQIDRYDLSSLTKAYSGGAPIPPSVVEAFQARTGVKIHPVYGMTETTSPAIAVPLAADPPLDPQFGALSVGLPIPGCECRVVSLETGVEMPPGETGELVMRGPNIVPGYWRKPEETAHALAGGWLHSGDVATRDEDGWFYVVDRVKDMIIASGYKIWPREVEDALFRHPAVREAAVIGVPDAYRGETVKAFVALHAGVRVSSVDLVGHCRERLAAYKVPHLIEIVAEVPKTATGKFSRRVLREAHRG